METNVSNFHPIGRDPESYHSGALVEAVTLKNVTLSELIGRYNLMLVHIAEQDRKIESLDAIIASRNIGA